MITEHRFISIHRLKTTIHEIFFLKENDTLQTHFLINAIWFSVIVKQKNVKTAKEYCVFSVHIRESLALQSYAE